MTEPVTALRILALVLILAAPPDLIAAPSATVDGGVHDTSGLTYNDPGATSTWSAVSISHGTSSGLSFSASAGGGSLTGSLHPYVSLSTYASNSGQFITQAWSNAGTWSTFHVTTKPGFAAPAPGTSVPIRVDYASTLQDSFGTAPVGWTVHEPYNMAFYLDDVNWRPYNTAGTLNGTVIVGEPHSIGIYTSLGSSTQNVNGAGAWARADLHASITPYVDPVWNAAHDNAFQVAYVSLAPPVPEPDISIALLAGLVIVMRKVRRREPVDPGLRA